MKVGSEQMRIWPGERQLLPLVPDGRKLLLHCISGKAYLRVMNQAHRQLLKAGDQPVIAGGEVATLSGIETMLFEIKNLAQKDEISDC
tara:strand:+ start:11187 stop:11450 length:264 start_codon:yes stop_codon:yes gene_type:complete